MNPLKIALVALSAALFMPTDSFAAPAKAAKTAPIAADAVVSVNGLVCDFCAIAIDKSLRRRAEVNDVRVDLTAKRVTIDFKPNAKLDEATLRKIITNAGYAVTGVQFVEPKS